jgi:hypothetical protein
MKPRRTIGLMLGGMATLVLALAPQAQARDSAKFKILSLSGTTAMERHVVYEPPTNGATSTCSFTQTENISFRSTRPLTAYAFTSKSHGRARVEWGLKPEFSGNLVELEVPGELTVSRTATYQQTITVDPDTGEASYGCYRELGPNGGPPTDCAVERTFPVTLRFGGTSDTENSTYVLADLGTRESIELRDACPVAYPPVADGPRLFSRASLFKKSLKRVKDTARVEEPAFDQAGGDTVTGTIVETLAGELKRKKLPKRAD